MPQEIASPRLARLNTWAILIAGIGIPAGVWLLAKWLLGDWSPVPILVILVVLVGMGVYLDYRIRCPRCGGKTRGRVTSQQTRGYFCSSCDVLWDTLVEEKRDSGG
jgi:hypothetical protein